MRHTKIASTILTTLLLSPPSYSAKPDWSLKNCPAPKIESRKVVSMDRAITEEITFKYCQDKLISAYLVSPLSTKLEKRSAILYVHWYEARATNSNRDEFLDEAKLMVQQGYGL